MSTSEVHPKEMRAAITSSAVFLIFPEEFQQRAVGIQHQSLLFGS